MLNPPLTSRHRFATSEISYDVLGKGVAESKSNNLGFAYTTPCLVSGKIIIVNTLLLREAEKKFFLAARSLKKTLSFFAASLMYPGT